MIECASRPLAGRKTLFHSPALPDGFTLLEMLAVVAVIALLAVLLAPLAGRAQMNALRTGAVSNMRQLATAFANYASDHQMTFPLAYQQSSSTYNRSYTNWELELASGGYLGEPDRPLKTASQGAESRYSVLGSPLQRKFHPTLVGNGKYNTFSGNFGILNANFQNAESSKNFRTVSSVQTAKTLLVCEGTTFGNLNGDFNSVIYPQNPGTYPNYVSSRTQPAGDDLVTCLYADGHVGIRKYSEFPTTVTARNSDAWIFWYGYSE